MGNAQATQLPVEEQIKNNQKVLKKAIRELDRERTKLVSEEQKCIREMKKLAKENQVTPVKIMAKDLVRNRKYQSRFLEMKAQLQGVSLQLQTIKSQETMTRAMKGTTKIMARMNQQMDPKQVEKIMREFMTENERAQMTQEVMNEAIDDAMEDDEMEEEQIVSQVLDEIGIEMGGGIASAGAGQIAGPGATAAPGTAAPVKQAEAIGGGDDDALEARLKALRGT